MVPFFILLNIFISVYIIRIKSRNPVSSWAWLVFMISIPYVGIIFYILFGQDAKQIKYFYDKFLKDKDLTKSFYEKYDKYYKTPETNEDILHISTLINNISQEKISVNNKVYIYVDGSHKFRELMLSIDSAKEFIHLEYYILRDDNLGRFLLNRLSAKAKEGVEVKLLVDAVGTFFNNAYIFEPLKQAGGTVAVFGKRHAIRVNYRNHRKLCIIDGKYGFIGGFNIGDEYIYSRKLGTWRDTHIKIHGDAVKSLELQFIKDWNFCSKNYMDIENKYFPILPNLEDKIKIQMVSSGPDTKWSSVHMSFLKLISSAKKYIYITTPYLMPDDSIVNALKVARLSGVEVKIVIPSISDHPFVLGGNLSNVSILLEAGIQSYMYKPSTVENAFIHSKQIIVDDKYTTLGTTNLDYRSFNLNFEINSIIYDEKIAINFREQFLKDVNSSEEITFEYFEEKTPIENLILSIARLLSPLL